MNKKIKYLLLGVFILLVLSLGVYKMNQNSNIKKANINTYDYLEDVLDCKTIVNLKMGTGEIVSEFKDADCFAGAFENLKGIPFEVGELKPGKLILESEEFGYCNSLYQEGGAIDYQNCIKDILPVLREKYPEIA